MNIRWLLAISFSAVFGFGLAAMWFSARYLEVALQPLLAQDSQGLGISSLHQLLVEQAEFLFLLLFLLLALVFVIMNGFVARPLRKLLACMEAFVKDGSRMQLGNSFGAPSEVKNLGEVFMRFEDSVIESHKRDVEVSRVKSDFISTAAHQLRTPLTGIRWAMEALEQENLTEGQRALIKSATDKSHELVSIVGTLLDISSIESGKYKYQFAPLDMESLLAEVANDFKPLSESSNVTLYYTPSAIPLPKVKADRERIKWILNNLVENAIRYTPAGGAVRIGSDSGAGRVYVRVQDSGIGILPEDRSNIFERFYRAGNAIAKENKGNGLGLYIARTIATDHGGDLNFTPNEGGAGTTFTLSLPLAS